MAAGCSGVQRKDRVRRDTPEPAATRDNIVVPRRAARTGAVTLVARFGSVLSLEFHLHMPFVFGVLSSDSSWMEYAAHASETWTAQELRGAFERQAEARGRSRHLVKRPGASRRCRRPG